MRIAHLSTSLSGGAGVAASRLAALQQKDGDVVILISSQINNRDFRKFLSKAITFYNRLITKKNFDLVTPLSVSRLDRKQLEQFKPDIVHIHNWYNLLSYRDMKYLLENFRVVLTVHDERILTGGCHLTLGCKSYLQECRGCPQVFGAKTAVRKSKEKIDELFANSSNFAIVSPSNWLKSKFSNSRTFSDKNIIYQIPNVYELELVEFDKDSKEKNQENTLRILFTAADTTSPNKGFNQALESVRLFAKNNRGINIHLLVIGSQNKSRMRVSSNFELRYVGKVDKLKVAEFMRGSDLLLVTSKSENFPNVVVEAQMLRLPVLATSVGGIPELIKDKETGILTENSVVGIAMGIHRFQTLGPQEILDMQNKAFVATSTITNSNVVIGEIKKVYLNLLKNGVS